MTQSGKELSYINDNGDTVYTSTYLANKGTCCKSNCLHCPYGSTLKNYSIELVEMSDKQIKLANEIIRDTRPVEQSELTSMLLAGAFGKKEQTRIHHVTKTNYSNFAFGTLKGVVCAVVEYSNKLSESSSSKRSIKDIYLKREFQDQGLGKEHVLR